MRYNSNIVPHLFFRFSYAFASVKAMAKAEHTKQLSGVFKGAKINKIVCIHRIGAITANTHSVAAKALFAFKHGVAAYMTVHRLTRHAPISGTSIGAVYSITFGTHNTSFLT